MVLEDVIKHVILFFPVCSSKQLFFFSSTLTNRYPHSYGNVKNMEWIFKHNIKFVRQLLVVVPMCCVLNGD